MSTITRRNFLQVAVLMGKVTIEFDHQKSGPLGQNPDDNVNAPTRNHIHTIMRMPNDNDYGKSLLQQHFHAFDHVQTARV